jgi:uncharacterized membrane protein
MDHGNIVKFGDWIGEGWNLFSKEWKTWTAMSVIALLPMVLFIIVCYILYFVVIFATAYGHSRTGAGSALTIVGVFFFIGFLVTIYLVFTLCGMFRAAMKQIHGEKIEVSDLWKGGRYVLPMILLYIVNSFLTCIGVLLCFFPAFIVQGLVYLSYPILVREDCGPIEAVQKSWGLAKKDWLMFTLFALVVGIVAQAGAYLCLIGIFFTFPLQFTIAAVAYRDCFESGAADSGTISTKPCKNCGKAIPGPANFCDHCGASQQ